VKTLPEGFADHNCADYPIFCSLDTIGSMAGACANPNIGIMTRTRAVNAELDRLIELLGESLICVRLHTAKPPATYGSLSPTGGMSHRTHHRACELIAVPRG